MAETEQPIPVCVRVTNANPISEDELNTIKLNIEKDKWTASVKRIDAKNINFTLCGPQPPSFPSDTVWCGWLPPSMLYAKHYDLCVPADYYLCRITYGDINVLGFHYGGGWIATVSHNIFITPDVEKITIEFIKKKKVYVIVAEKLSMIRVITPFTQVLEDIPDVCMLYIPEIMEPSATFGTGLFNRSSTIDKHITLVYFDGSIKKSEKAITNLQPNVDSLICTCQFSEPPDRTDGTSGCMYINEDGVLAGIQLGGKDDNGTVTSALLPSHKLKEITGSFVSVISQNQNLIAMKELFSSDLGSLHGSAVAMLNGLISAVTNGVDELAKNKIPVEFVSLGGYVFTATLIEVGRKTDLEPWIDKLYNYYGKINGDTTNIPPKVLLTLLKNYAKRRNINSESKQNAKSIIDEWDGKVVIRSALHRGGQPGTPDNDPRLHLTVQVRNRTYHIPLKFKGGQVFIFQDITYE